jgi:hypothetical protein
VTEVVLTIPEFISAVESAKLRLTTSVAMGLNDATTYKRNWIERLTQETQGVCGEMALGKLAGVWFVPSVNTFHRVPDCFADTEVRATGLANGSLILRGNDPDDRRYILTIVDAPKVSIIGWLYGHEGKRDEFLRNPNGYRESWFVPQDCLRPMESFEFSRGGEAARTGVCTT